MTAPVVAFFAVLVLCTSFIAGVFGMAGGMILMGGLLLILPVANAMVLQRDHATRLERLARGVVAGPCPMAHRPALRGRPARVCGPVLSRQLRSRSEAGLRLSRSGPVHSVSRPRPACAACHGARRRRKLRLHLHVHAIRFGRVGADAGSLFRQHRHRAKIDRRDQGMLSGRDAHCQDRLLRRRAYGHRGGGSFRSRSSRSRSRRPSPARPLRDPFWSASAITVSGTTRATSSWPSGSSTL